MGAWRSGFLTCVVSGGVGLCTGVPARGQSAGTGPIVSHVGIANADGSVVLPVSVDETGRPLFQRILGQSFFLVFEGGPGESGRRLGARTFNHDAEDPSVLPDLQVLVADALGNGSAAVCDSSGPNAGGVPATDPLVFEPIQSVSDAINDLGCRFDDGEGGNFGRDREQACTMSNDGFGFGFVSPETSLQFCAFVAPAFALATGETLFAVRLRDVEGNVGPVEEMVLRITGPVPTPTPLPSCPGDCDRNGSVSVGELIRAVDVALSSAPLASCDPADDNRDGGVTIDELTAAVGAALTGCAPVTAE